MAHGISGISNDGYFHHVDDSTQLKTAQRSTFQATAGNKLSNWFLGRDSGKLRKIGSGLKALRRADLATRRTFTDTSRGLQRFGVRVGAVIDKVKVLDNPAAKAEVAWCRDRKLDYIHDRADLKKMRLNWKARINAAAPGEMAATIEKATTEFQQHLRAMDYRPLANLSAVSPKRGVPVFMRNVNGHRVRTADQKLPLLARKVAGMGSRQYENGVAGLERAIKRSGQYAAIGLSNTLQLARQGFYSAAAKVAPRESEERNTFLRHAGRAHDMRRLNSAALKGNQAFANKFEQIRQEQASARSISLEASGYQEVAAEHDAAPGRTRYSARKMDTWFGGEDGAKRSKTRKIASAYVALVNVEARLSRYHHGRKVRWASRQADTPRMQEIRGYHEAKRLSAQFRIDTSRAALDGKLKDIVRGPVEDAPQSDAGS